MHYDDAVAAFFPARPAGTPVPAAVRDGSPARRLRDAAEPLATHPIWARRINAAQAELGLDFLSGYVWGRAAALGSPTPGAAVAAFAWFEPDLVAAVLAAGQAAASREDLLAVRDRESAASVEELLAGEDLDAAADLLTGAARVLPAAGRPLYAGLLERALPAGPAGRVQRACELLREARGDAHAAVAVAAGLGPVEMNVLTERWLGMPPGSYAGSRGWSEPAQAAAAGRLQQRGWLAGEELTDDGRSARAALEATTDAAMAPVVDSLGADLDLVVGRLAAWGERCVEAGAFPADVLKRAAG
ncbi:MAG TPA: hypothetical protein VFR07_19035 [Mycobacteriales bacterium]|nr:hypothetical protein [Mycobacteriales bacterium]